MSADIKINEITNKALPSSPLLFIKGDDPVQAQQTGTGQMGSDGLVKKIQESMAEAMGAKNVAFLLGAGCSSYTKEGAQLGIPTMQPLAHEFTTTVGGRNDRIFLNATERGKLKTSFGIDLSKSHYSNNLEDLMEVLYSWKFSLSSSSQRRHATLLKSVNRIIGKLKRFLFERCSAGEFAKSDSTVQELYESFYRKLIYRDRSLPRPWVFTTNYDLFNETAMDRLGLANQKSQPSNLSKEGNFNVSAHSQENWTNLYLAAEERDNLFQEVFNKFQNALPSKFSDFDCFPPPAKVALGFFRQQSEKRLAVARFELAAKGL